MQLLAGWIGKHWEMDTRHAMCFHTPQVRPEVKLFFNHLSYSLILTNKIKKGKIEVHLLVAFLLMKKEYLKVYKIWQDAVHY